MSEPREPMRRVVVVGAGQVGLLTAIGLRRALPGCEVVVVGLAPDRAAFADHAATALPFTNKLHDRLGIEESQLVLQAGGSHRLATRYFGWGGEGQHGLLTYGEDADPALRTRFARQWGGGGRNVGGAQPAGSVAEALADAGRFAPPSPDAATPLSDVDYALRWNPPAYHGLLIGMAGKAQLGHVAGVIAAIEADGAGGIAALAIEGQGTLDADLFVDCSGSAALLAAAMPEYEFEGWGDVLPVRQVLVGRPGQPMLALEDRVSLLPEGWLSELAGRDGLQAMLAIGEGQDQDAAIRALGVEPVAAIPVSPGRIRAPWSGNVVALGDAAARFEPLGHLNLDLAHRQIELLLEMLPGREIVPQERAEYNRRAGLMFDAVRDVLALHYASARAREIFPQASAPERVQVAIDQYVRRGRLPYREEAPLLKQEDMQLLGALGFAQGLAPQHGAIAPQEIEAAQTAFAAKAKAALDYAPPYDRWMASLLQSSQAPTG